MRKINHTSLAFTLAEVLITLGIIGIVAAMTIPTLISNSNKQDTVAKVKKIYSTLAQATFNIQNDCGGNISACITSATSSTDNDPTSRTELAALYKAKLHIAKDCTDGSTGCFANTTYKYLNNGDEYNLTTNVFFANSQMVLNDGVTILFDWGAWHADTFVIHVDINGAKDPNQVGKDTFVFSYNPLKKALIPVIDNDCTLSGYGFGCAKKIILENAITYY